MTEIIKVNQDSNQFYEKNVHDLIEDYAIKDKLNKNGNGSFHDHIASLPLNIVCKD
jgi:hypothetical protein